MKLVLKFTSLLKLLSKVNIFDMVLHLVVQYVNAFDGGNLVFVPSSGQSEALRQQIRTYLTYSHIL